MTADTITQPAGGGISLDDARVVRWDDVVGAREVAEILSGLLHQKITSPMVSTWAMRCETTGFPRPLPMALARGGLWDRNDFVNADGTPTWTGPPGRWPAPNAEG